MAESTVCAIFPIPIYITECDVDIAPAAKFLNSHQDLLPNDHAQIYGNKSVDDYLLDRAECNELKSFIILHIEKYADKIMAWNFERFEITQSWLTIKFLGEAHGLHFHANSVLSGVFYFDDYQEETSNLVLHRPAIMSQLMTQFAPVTDRKKMDDTEFPWNEWEIKPKKNQLVLFPSWLGHSVRPNTAQHARKCLAFNAVPAGKFGSKESATEIEFNRLV